MIARKDTAALLLLFALALPGVANGLQFGYRVAGLMSCIIAVLFFLEVIMTPLPRRLGPPGRSGRRLYAVAALLSMLYVVAGIRALLNDVDLIREATQSMLVVNTSTMMAGFTAIIILIRVDADNFLGNLGEAISKALVVLLTIEAALLVLGIKHKLIDEMPQVREQALLLSVLGLHVSRTLLPISTGVVNGAILPLAGLLVSILYLSKTRFRAVAFLWLGPLSLLLILVNDTRSFLVGAPISVLFCLWFSGRKRLAQTLALAAPVLPPLMAGFSSFVVPLLGSALSARYDTFGMFSGRGFIWSTAMGQWAASGSDLQHVLGSGLYGQAASGISIYYSQLFSSFAETGSELASVHNSYLQATVDVGLVGVTTLAIFVGALVGRLSELAHGTDHNGRAGRALLAILLALMIIAGTEVIVSPYCREAVTLISVLFFAVALTGHRRNSRKTREKTQNADRYSRG